MSAFFQQPTALREPAGFSSLPRVPRRVDARVVCTHETSSPWPPDDPRSLCPHTGAVIRGSSGRVDVLRLRREWGQAVSRHAGWLRLRPVTAGFHSRRPECCVCFHFFPLSVGFGPTASWARGAFTVAPSRLCHFQAMPSKSSYSPSPLRQRATNTPWRFHCWKYLCTELELPNTAFGRDFHWHPVRRTYTMASKTRRAGAGFLPAPGLRLYLRPFGRRLFGISGSTLAHNSSDTSQQRMALMPSNIRSSETKTTAIYG